MSSRRTLVAAARTGEGVDLLLTNALLVNVLTRMVDGPVDIAIVGDRIASVLPAGAYTYDAVVIHDAAGRHVAPGFVDAHVHNESSMVTPAQWAKAIVPLGTTTVCTDPHEIANVLGLPGIDYMLQASAGLPLHYFVTASSCVPAVPSLETAGAVFTANEMTELLGWDRVIGVAEAMDYPGLINQTGNITPIVEVGHTFGVPIEGHTPTVMDRDLQAYLAATGPRSSDHESAVVAEMRQKVAAGMMVYGRASTFGDSMGALARTIRSVGDTRMFGFCTDDIFAHHLLSRGHLNHGMRRLIEEGIDPVTVIQMATINAAQHFFLHAQGIGAIAPGWRADIVVLDDLHTVEVRDVIVDGRLVVRDKVWTVDVTEPVPPLLINTVRCGTLTKQDFVLKLDAGAGRVVVNALDLATFTPHRTQLTVKVDVNGHVTVPAGAVTLAVVPRHNQGTPPMLALGINYPLRDGAIASTVAHDSHNILIIGSTTESMLIATQTLKEIGGGFVAVKSGKVIATVPLPIAGLMSAESLQVVANQLHDFEAAMPLLDLPATFPLLLIALALPVVPDIRITDRGMVDVATQQFIPLLWSASKP